MTALKNFVRNLGDLLGVVFLMLCGAVALATFGFVAGTFFLGFLFKEWLGRYFVGTIKPTEMDEMSIQWDETRWIAYGTTLTGFHLYATGRSPKVALSRLASQVEDLKRDLKT